MKYEFVRLKRRGGCEDGTWFFHPRSEAQVIEHFKDIFGAEIRASVREYFNTSMAVADKSMPNGYWVYTPHPTTPFARAIETYKVIYNESWLSAAARLENVVLNQRIKDYRNGKEMYFDNGVLETRKTEDDTVMETIELDGLAFPPETQCRLEDVRYMRWNMPDLQVKGTHWYAKLGNRDVVDKDGNIKWNTKAEAESAARWFVNKINCRRYNE